MVIFGKKGDRHERIGLNGLKEDCLGLTKSASFRRLRPQKQKKKHPRRPPRTLSTKTFHRCDRIFQLDIPVEVQLEIC